jgi:hypothetical protein
MRMRSRSIACACWGSSSKVAVAAAVHQQKARIVDYCSDAVRFLRSVGGMIVAFHEEDPWSLLLLLKESLRQEMKLLLLLVEYGCCRCLPMRQQQGLQPLAKLVLV